MSGPQLVRAVALGYDVGARVLTALRAGGIGKTRLALQVLATVAADFPDGVWLVELDDLREPRLVVPRVASAVGVPGEPGRPLIDTLADALAPRRMLLALDNCEHLIEACARLCQRLLGSARFRVFYLVCLVGAAVTQLTVSATIQPSPYPTLGASA